MNKLTEAQIIAVVQFLQKKQLEFLDLSTEISIREGWIKFEIWTRNEKGDFHLEDATMQKTSCLKLDVDVFMKKVIDICRDTRELMANDSKIQRV